MFQYQCDESAIFLPDEGYGEGPGESGSVSPPVPASTRSLPSAANYHLMFVWAPQCEELLWSSVSEGWYYDGTGIILRGREILASKPMERAFFSVVRPIGMRHPSRGRQSRVQASSLAAEIACTPEPQA